MELEYLVSHGNSLGMLVVEQVKTLLKDRTYLETPFRGTRGRSLLDGAEHKSGLRAHFQRGSPVDFVATKTVTLIVP